MRGRVEPKKIEFGTDQICPSCRGKGRKTKNSPDCWTCGGRGVVRKEEK